MSDNAITDARETSRKDSVFSFISDVKRVFPAEFLNASVRATPHGLFVEESSLGRIIEGYQSWLAQATAGEVVKSPGKCMKRLFGSTEPVRQYLIEGKQCLIGMLIKSEIAHAQSLGLPYFLGSLTSMREFIHPRDPIFSSLKNIEVVNTSQGSVYRLSSAGPNYDVPEERLRSFASIAARSSIILRQEPKLPESLAAALRALISMLEKSRAAGGDKEILVPSRFSDQERYNFKILGSFTFVFDRNNTLQHCYDLRSSNLFRFIREEFKHFGHQRTIGFEPARSPGRTLGMLHCGRDRFALSARAFLQFLQALRNSPDKREHFKRVYTVRDCFERFSEIFQRSTFIERGKISSHLEGVRRNIRSFRISGPWIFAVSPRGDIELCIAKHAASRPHHGAKYRSGGRGRGERGFGGGGRRRSGNRRNNPPGSTRRE